MQEPKIYADFQNADAKGRIRLNCNGTLEDLARHKIQLTPGLALTLYSDDSDDTGNSNELLAAGIAEYSAEEQVWVAVIDWAGIHHGTGGPNVSLTPRLARNVG
jgi:hypothetical protein